MTSEAGSNSAEGSVSVGQDDPERERLMEEEQRRQDDGIGLPPEANPHAKMNRREDKRPVKGAKPAVRSALSPEPSKAIWMIPITLGKRPMAVWVAEVRGNLRMATNGY